MNQSLLEKANLNKKVDIAKDKFNQFKDSGEKSGLKIKQNLEKRGIKFQAISLFVDMKKRKQEAEEFISDVADRHDIPHGPMVPRDLDDKKGDWIYTADGFSVRGKVLQDDTNIGSTSPIVPVLLVLWVFLIPLLSMAPTIGKVALVAYLYTLYLYVGFWATVGMVLAILLPTQVIAMIPGLSMVADKVLPVSISTITSLIPAVLPYLYWKLKAKRRASMLSFNAVNDASSSFSAPGKTISRWEQASNARKDKTQFLELGTAEGEFSKLGDKLSPDAGMPFGLSIGDMSKHVLILGSTGTGKTSGGIRPIVLGIIEDEMANEGK